MFTAREDRVVLAYCEPKAVSGPSTSVKIYQFLPPDVDTTEPSYIFDQGVGQKTEVPFNSEGFMNDRFCVDHSIVGTLNGTLVSIGTTDQ